MFCVSIRPLSISFDRHFFATCSSLALGHCSSVVYAFISIVRHQLQLFVLPLQIVIVRLIYAWHPGLFIWCFNPCSVDCDEILCWTRSHLWKQSQHLSSRCAESAAITSNFILSLHNWNEVASISFFEPSCSIFFQQGHLLRRLSYGPSAPLLSIRALVLYHSSYKPPCSILLINTGITLHPSPSSHRWIILSRSSFILGNLSTFWLPCHRSFGPPRVRRPSGFIIDLCHCANRWIFAIIFVNLAFELTAIVFIYCTCASGTISQYLTAPNF